MNDPAASVLVGLDGLDGDETAPEPGERGTRTVARPLRLSKAAGDALRREIRKAGGREVCFLASVDEERVVHGPRAVSRGNFEAVLVAARDAPEGGVMLHNHPSGVLEPSDADLRVAATLYDQGLGTAITDNGATELYVVVEPPPPRTVERLDREAVLGLLAPEGILARRMTGYEDRPGQRTMVSMVIDAFNDGGVTLVEAGTGTGKSLAYLVPAALWAQKNRERTIVSTNTINLQEQLVGKDLPLVEKLVGEVSWALVKGRGNYVSIRRALLAAEGQENLFEDDRSSEMRALVDWLRTTVDGSLSDLEFSPSEDVWEEVRSDPDMCLRARCPHFQACFYQKSRRDAASADLLVVNHHLLFTDLAVRRATRNYRHAAVLPPYRRVVLDEAHNVEDSATSHLGVEITRTGLYRVLSRLDRRGRGILTVTHEALSSMDGGRPLRERMESQVRPAVAKTRASVERLIECLEPLVAGAPGSVRLGPRGVGEPAEHEEVAEPLRVALSALTTLHRELAELRSRIELLENPSERLEARILDLRSVERRIAAATHGLRLVLVPDPDAVGYVRWLDLRGARRRNLVLAAAPVELGDLLHESLFSKAETTVLVSATLSTRGTFQFMKLRLGLAGPAMEARVLGDRDVPRLDERVIDSPFDFQRKALLAVPTDGDGGELDGVGFQRMTAQRVEALAEVTDGGLFVLFTSHTALRRVASDLRTRGVDARWPILVQGEDQRHGMIQAFTASGRAILLGTNSFWEGVDVPGEPLRGLVIQRIPFRVPTEPVTAARMEAVERDGGDSFRDFMLPHAALRLKQGFGRLIRGHHDRGVVLVLDDRLVTRRYGRVLRASLPPAPLVKGEWPLVLRRIAAFYRTSLGRDPDPL